MRYFLALLTVVCFALPAFGSTHYITVLGTEPLFPMTESRTQFLAMIRKYPDRERTALALLGIDQSAFEQGMRSAKSMVTQAPFKLDAMAYYDGQVKVVHDVAVPTHTYMWVIPMHRRTVYVPQICGNISTLATTAAESYRARGPIARTTPPPIVSTPLVQTPEPQIAQATVPPIVQAAHHARFPWWIFLVPVAIVEASHGGPSSSPSSPPVGPTPTPTPTGTPTSTPTPTPTPTGTPTSTPTPTPTPTSTPTGIPTPTPTPTCTPTGVPTPTPTPTPTKTPCPTPTPKPTPTPCPTATKSSR
ncbi:MAG TPA: hypothetical protein VEJ41_04405 [Candidatus Acidoferrales bacterium]|nr:hypothetical protein [Candidatus Acidoferrales bacterium]